MSLSNAVSLISALLEMKSLHGKNTRTTTTTMAPRKNGMEKEENDVGLEVFWQFSPLTTIIKR